MKKVLAGLLLLCLSLGVAACGKNNEETTGNANQNNAEQYEDIQNTQNEPVKNDGDGLTFSEVEGSKELNALGGYFVKWKITNNTKDTISVSNITVCFYDDEDTMLEKDSRFMRYSLKKGESGLVLFSCDKEYSYCEVNSSEYTVLNKSDSYDEYAILSFEEPEGKMQTSIGYQTEWKVKNDSEWTLPYITVTVCFYDDKGTIIEADSRFLDVGINSGKAAIMKFTCDDDYSYCGISSYTYKPASANLSLPNNSNTVEIDMIGETVDFWSE